jgi:ArsR family transcriptional regulator, cadmium/lead-responsive transcriptional repressor
LHEEVGKVNDAAGVVFEALADPTRRRVVYELSKDGPLTATELAKRIPVTRQAIAKHFAALEEAKLAVGVHVGRETRYELRTQAFAEAEAWMRAIGATWDQRLARFKEFVESVPSGAAERRQR